jgi:large subunit ribosomal protein L24
MVTRSILPRKQRRAAFRASNAERHRRMAVALSRELRARYGRRQLPVRKGDTVRVIAGSYKGQEERVSEVNLRGFRLTLENVTVKKVDQKLKPLPIRPSHLILTRLNLADPWRRRVLRVASGEAAAEESVAPAEAPAETSAPDAAKQVEAEAPTADSAALEGEPSEGAEAGEGEPSPGAEDGATPSEAKTPPTEESATEAKRASSASTSRRRRGTQTKKVEAP